MIVRALDSDGDWTFGKGRNDYKQANEAVIQSIGTRLKSFLGDCFFAADAGIDWFGLLGSKNQLALELAVRATILNTPEVTGIVDTSVSLNRATREITMSYTVTSIYSGNTAFTISDVTTFILTEEGNILATEDGDSLLGG